MKTFIALGILSTLLLTGSARATFLPEIPAVPTEAIKALLGNAAADMRAIRFDEAASTLPSEQRTTLFDRRAALQRTITDAIAAADESDEKARGLVYAALDRVRHFGLSFPFLMFKWPNEAQNDFVEVENMLFTALTMYDRHTALASNGVWHFGGYAWVRLARAEYPTGKRLCAKMKVHSTDCTLPDPSDLRTSMESMKNIFDNPIFGLDAVTFTKIWIDGAFPPLKGTVAFDVRTRKVRESAPDEHNEVLCTCKE